MPVFIIMDKIEHWNDELGELMMEEGDSNPILGRVLEHTAHSDDKK
jgi:hypothetical protein